MCSPIRIRLQGSHLLAPICLALVVIAISGCGGKESYGTLSTEVTGDDLKLCETKMEILFPAEAKPLGIWKQEEPNESIKLKLEMSRSELQLLMQQSPFKGKPLAGDSDAAFGPNLDWWDPGKKKNMKVGFVQLTEQDADLSIGIDDEASDTTIVYLVWVVAKH